MPDLFQSLSENADKLEANQSAVMAVHDHLARINETLQENGWADVSLNRKKDRVVIRVVEPQRTLLERAIFSGVSKYVVFDAALDRDVDIRYDAGDFWEGLAREAGERPEGRAIADHLAIGYVQHVAKRLSLSPDQIRTIASGLTDDAPRVSKDAETLRSTM